MLGRWHFGCKIGLKMLGLYLDTLIIGYKSRNMLRTLNKLTLQKKLQNCVANNLFFDKTVKTHQQQNKQLNIKNPYRSWE